MKEDTLCKIEGFITIFDEDKNIILEKKNSINFENMSLALARSLANRDPGPIFRMSFGNGGSSIDALGTISYLEPNVIGQNAALYNQTYEKIVDDSSASNLDPVQNNLAVEHEDTKFYTDVIVTATLDYAEPSGQQAFDTSTSSGDYIFDEIGLKSSDGLLLTHVIFHPVQKSLNRVIEIVYVLRISIA